MTEGNRACDRQIYPSCVRVVLGIKPGSKVRVRKLFILDWSLGWNGRFISRFFFPFRRIRRIEYNAKQTGRLGRGKKKRVFSSPAFSSVSSPPPPSSCRHVDIVSRVINFNDRWNIDQPWRSMTVVVFASPPPISDGRMARWKKKVERAKFKFFFATIRTKHTVEYPESKLSEWNKVRRTMAVNNGLVELRGK